MANSAFSSFSDRASGTFSHFRDRLGGGGRRQDRYDDYDGYDDYDDRDYAYDYGEYGYDNRAGDPYDDIDDASGVGEVRTRTVASDSRYHPPLLSFDEARTNTYVPDRLLRDPLERQREQRVPFERPGANYTPRVRDSVNMGRAAEYDVTKPGDMAREASENAGEAAPAAAAAVSPSAAGDYDPYATYRGVGTTVHAPTRKVKAIAPVGYSEVESIARALKAGDLVVLVLTRTPAELAKRVLDFSFGVASALDASVDYAADKVFVVSRGRGLTDLERQQLQAQGIIL